MAICIRRPYSDIIAETTEANIIKNSMHAVATHIYTTILLFTKWECVYNCKLLAAAAAANWGANAQAQHDGCQDGQYDDSDDDSNYYL